MPSLRWRQAEYQALLHLKPSIKAQIVPLIVIPDIEFDFEKRITKKTVHDHVSLFVTRFKKKWGTRPAWITLKESIALSRMDDGSHIFDYVFNGLRVENALAIPAVPLSTDPLTISAVSRAISYDNRGAGLIIRLEDLMKKSLAKSITALVNSLTVPLNETDLIIDLGAPNFQPYTKFATALINAWNQLGSISKFRNCILLSTAIPNTSRNIAKGSDVIPRHDWLFYQELMKKLPAGMRRPIYGDYTIVHPDFTPLDMRKIKVSGKIIYTTPKTWATRKGGSFRDNRGQMHDHCSMILNDSSFKFCGQSFSEGDRYISDCAHGLEGPSNLTRWKSVGINHHITLVVQDLANLAA